MKRIIPILAATCMALLFFSCKKEKINELTEFDINYSNSVAVPSNTIALNQEMNFTTPEFSTQSSNKFTENKTAQNLVDEVRLTKFNISVPGGNMDFLKSLAIYIKAEGMGETLVADKANVPTGITSLALDLKDVNIRDYIFKQNIQFRVTVVIDGSTLNGQTLSMDETVHVKATILK